MNKQEERIQQLLKLLSSSDSLHIKEAAKQLNVSEMTIRRDLNSISSQSLHLLGGYIINPQEYKDITHYFVSEQQQRNVNEKMHIGRLAAALIQNDDTIFFDCGTTTPYVIESIPKHIHFTGVCYSINVFLALQKCENCKVILCGGQFEANNAIFSLINDQSPLDIICPSKSFISAAGISLKGITCFSFPEVSWKVKAINQSNVNILIADSSKFDELKPAYFGQLSDFDILISNNVNEQYTMYCDENNIKIYQ